MVTHEGDFYYILGVERWSWPKLLPAREFQLQLLDLFVCCCDCNYAGLLLYSCAFGRHIWFDHFWDFVTKFLLLLYQYPFVTVLSAPTSRWAIRGIIEEATSEGTSLEDLYQKPKWLRFVNKRQVLIHFPFQSSFIQWYNKQGLQESVRMVFYTPL